jgi:hypothetical protein
VTRTWNIDQTLAAAFVEECRLAATDDVAFSTFRRGTAMGTVVENTGSQWAQMVIDHAAKFVTPYRLREIAYLLQPLDTVGGPALVDVTIDGTTRPISGTTARYVKTIALLEWCFGRLDGLCISEIGGGYGGLCAAIHKISKPCTYSIYDLPDVKRLQRRFLDALAIPFVTLREDTDLTPAPDLVIATCSLSELPRPMQKVYFDNVVKYAKRGFLVWNSDYTEGDDIVQGNEATEYLATQLGFRGEWLTERFKIAGIDYEEGDFTYIWSEHGKVRRAADLRLDDQKPSS